MSAKPEAAQPRQLPVLAPHNLPFQLHLLVQLLTRRLNAVLEPFDLTPLHWGILCCLWERDGLPTQSIAQHLQQLGGTITVGLDTMERRRLVRRKQDSLDQRISHVWLTRRAVAMKKELVPQVSLLVDRMFACFTPQEYDDLAAKIDHLQRHVGAIKTKTKPS